MSENPSAAADVKPYLPRRAPEPASVAGVPLPALMDGSRGGGGHQMAAEQRSGVEGMEEEEEEVEEEEEEEEHEGMAIENLDGQLGDAHALLVPQPSSNQLTLSFQGEVYVFDSVSPEKVQAVLLLLGGREITGGLALPPSSSHQYNKRSNFPQRVASLMRFREKRKERNFDKKIRYSVRKEVALRMQRKKGQFTSSKSKPEDATSNNASLDATQRWGADDRPQAAAACHNCGINSGATPMMRRGPDGPRTLCNACGLMWANKGTLRDPSKIPPPSLPLPLPLPLPPQNPLPEIKEGNGITETMDGQQQQSVNANGHEPSS